MHTLLEDGDARGAQLGMQLMAAQVRLPQMKYLVLNSRQRQRPKCPKRRPKQQLLVV